MGVPRLTRDPRRVRSLEVAITPAAGKARRDNRGCASPVQPAARSTLRDPEGHCDLGWSRPSQVTRSSPSRSAGASAARARRRAATCAAASMRASTSGQGSELTGSADSCLRPSRRQCDRSTLRAIPHSHGRASGHRPAWQARPSNARSQTSPSRSSASQRPLRQARYA